MEVNLMPTNFKYYGGNKIESSEIKKEIELIESLDQNKDLNSENLENFHSLECRFSDHTSWISIGEQLAEGGEGVVFKTNDPQKVAKIYFPKMRTKVREGKINLMVKNQLNDSRLCWPEGALYDNGRFVGLLMPYVSGEKIDFELGHMELNDFFRKDRRNLLKTLINVAGIFETLKENAIVMGDVNFGNFIIDPDNYNVVLIDLDGAQIDKYPCIGCKENFNAPELFEGVEDEDENEEHVANLYYHGEYSTYHRDQYSLAAYIFMMIMCVAPYQIKSERTVISLRDKHFGFEILEEDTRHVWRREEHSNRWSHLPYFMREAFYTCFTTDNPAKRPTAKQWKAKLSFYLDMLNESNYKNLDKDCLVIYKVNGIDYGLLEHVKMIVSKQYFGRGFSMLDAIRRIKREMGHDFLSLDVDERSVAEILKEKTEFVVNKNTKMKLTFNIGVLKKICLEIKLTY